MAEAGEVLEGRRGFRLRLIQTAAETDGELLAGTARRFEPRSSSSASSPRPTATPAEEGVNLFEEFSDEIRLVAG